MCRPLASAARVQHSVDFAALMPAEIWTESSSNGLRTTIGREGRAWRELALDDVTPHWLVGGRTGSGKTVFLLDVLYGLASRYSPDELVLYLLDFKEGVSFAEFTPTPIDGSWIPHARTVGIESDREYGLAVLRELSREMSRRAVELKRAGVTRIVDLRAGRPDLAMPRPAHHLDEAVGRAVSQLDRAGEPAALRVQPVHARALGDGEQVLLRRQVGGVVEPRRRVVSRRSRRRVPGQQQVDARRRAGVRQRGQPGVVGAAAPGRQRRAGDQQVRQVVRAGRLRDGRLLLGLVEHVAEGVQIGGRTPPHLRLDELPERREHRAQGAAVDREHAQGALRKGGQRPQQQAAQPSGHPPVPGVAVDRDVTGTEKRHRHQERRAGRGGGRCRRARTSVRRGSRRCRACGTGRPRPAHIPTSPG